MCSLSDTALGKILLSLKPLKALNERHEESTYLACDLCKKKKKRQKLISFGSMKFFLFLLCTQSRELYVAFSSHQPFENKFNTCSFKGNIPTSFPMQETYFLTNKKYWVLLFQLHLFLHLKNMLQAFSCKSKENLCKGTPHKSPQGCSKAIAAPSAAQRRRKVY